MQEKYYFIHFGWLHVLENTSLHLYIYDYVNPPLKNKTWIYVYCIIELVVILLDRFYLILHFLYIYCIIGYFKHSKECGFPSNNRSLIFRDNYQELFFLRMNYQDLDTGKLQGKSINIISYICFDMKVPTNDLIRM